MRTSCSIKNISAALVAFQAEVDNPKYSADNPFYKSKYTPLQDILRHVRPVLGKHGLAVIQNPQEGKQHFVETNEVDKNGEVVTVTRILQNITVTTRLLHSSGEWIEGDPLTMTAEKMTPQGAGSVITYARRYALSAILGIASELDDDGNSAEPNGPPQQSKPAPPPAKKKEPKQREGFISTAQARKLFSLAGKGNEDIVKAVLAEYKLDGTAKVPELLYKDICDKVSTISAERKGQ